MDAIEIAGLRYYSYIGFLPEEKVLGQWFEVDLTLWLDLTLVGNSDRLEDTLDYRQAIDLVRQQMETSKDDMIEYVTTQIIRLLLQLDKVEKVRVRLTKVSPPIPGFGGKISIELTRNKDSF